MVPPSDPTSETPDEPPIIKRVEANLREQPRTWLITGVAGFIGSHLAEQLLALGQQVIGIDNFDTGKAENIDAIVDGAIAKGSADAGTRLRVIETDVRNYAALERACEGVDHVLHHAAVASVPRTLSEPRDSHAVNVEGSFNVFEVARAAGVRSVVFASSSAVYGDCPGDPETGAQREQRIGRSLSPYATHKHIGEQLGQTMTRSFGLSFVGLRYFNIVGPRQDPAGAYAAVIPKWVALLAKGEQPAVFGDGLQTRDFCPVADVVQANLLAATWAERTTPEQRERPGDPSEAIFNVGLGERTTLLDLYELIYQGMVNLGAPCEGIRPRHADPRVGDIVHSRANIDRTREQLGYAPRVSLQQALIETMTWLVHRKEL